MIFNILGIFHDFEKHSWMCRSGLNGEEGEGQGDYTHEIHEYMIRMRIIHKKSHVNDLNNCLLIYLYIKYIFTYHKTFFLNISLYLFI